MRGQYTQQRCRTLPGFSRDFSSAADYKESLMPAMTNKTSTGTVTWFNPVKGYGFISLDEGPLIFFDRAALHDPEQLQLYEGEEVQFEIVTGERGQEASNIILLEPCEQTQS
jgi:cold shock protein